MKLSAIRTLVSTYSLDQLREAETCLYDEKQPEIEVEGDDAGEQLTHILAAISILEDMARGTSERDALRNFSQRVRNSLS